MEETDFKIEDIFGILKNQWKTVAGIIAMITLFVAIINFFVIKPVYEVNTKVFIGKEKINDVKYDNNDVEMYQRLVKTYSEIVMTKDLIQNAISKNNLDVTPLQVINILKITPMPDTQILEITYQNTDKTLAKEVLVAVVDEFMTETKELIPNVTVKVIESAEVPQKPISPQKEINTIIACLVGLMFGTATVLLKEYMDDTFKTKEQTEKIMEISVIGMIPCGEKN